MRVTRSRKGALTAGLVPDGPVRGRSTRARELRAQRAELNERGFTIVESMVAMGVVFTVLMGLIGTVGAGVKGVVLSRQRLGATSIANEVLE